MKLAMKHFAIFLSIAIVFYACVDLPRVEIGEDDFKADQDARKAASLDANQTITDDKAIRSNDDQTSAHSSDCASNKAETCEKPSSVAMSMSVASERKKSGQSTQLRKPAIDLLSLLNYSHRNIAANQHSIGDNRSLPRTSAPIRDTGITYEMLTSRKFREERRGRKAHRSATNGTIEGLEDLDTYGIISQVVKGYVEAPTKVEYRFIHGIVEQICHSADSQLEDFAPGYWSEVVRLSNRHTAPRETSAVLRRYFEMKLKETRPFMDEYTLESHIKSMRIAYEEGETVERVITWFECPNKEVETRFQTWDINWIVQMFVDFLCMVTGFIAFIIYLIIVWQHNILKAKEKAMHIKKSSTRDEYI